MQFCICDLKKRPRSGSGTPREEATEASASWRLTLLMEVLGKKRVN
jgi:hypothetical protein